MPKHKPPYPSRTIQIYVTEANRHWFTDLAALTDDSVSGATVQAVREKVERLAQGRGMEKGEE